MGRSTLLVGMFISLVLSACVSEPNRTVASEDPVSLHESCAKILSRETGTFRLKSLANGEAFSELKRIASEIERAESQLKINPNLPELSSNPSPASRVVELLQQRYLNVLAEISRHSPITRDDSQILKSCVGWKKKLEEVAITLDADRRLIFDEKADLYLIHETDYGQATTNSQGLADGATEVQIENGLLFNEGVLLDTKGKRWNFAWNSQRSLRTGMASSLLFHDNLFPNEDLAMAGEWIVKAGRITLLTDRSGHFSPPRFLTGQFMDWLRSKRVHYRIRKELLAPEGSSRPIK